MKLNKIKYIFLTIAGSMSIIISAQASTSSSTANEQEKSPTFIPITFGQVYGTGTTKNAAYGAAYAKIPSGYSALKVSYTGGRAWTCRIEYGK